MNSVTLYRKYRPKTFTEVIGQKHITDTLAQEVLTNKIGHAYLFCGTRGTGKTSVAKIFARAVNCLKLRENGDPCNECDACRGLLSGSVMDVLEIDAASNNGVDHVRELRNEVSFVPSAVKFRVYIIDEVHMMTSSAFNALLKTLEEPPAHAIFILATTEANKVPATIQSRCQRFDFRRLSGSDIVANLEKIAKQEGFSIEKDASNLIAVLSDGAMRDAISMLESVKSASEGNITTAITREILGVPSPEKYIELVYAIAENSIGDALTLSNEIINKSGDAASFANQLLEHFRDLAVCKNLSDPSDIIERPAEVVKKLQQQAEKFTNEKIILCMQKLCELIALGKSAALTKALIESGIVLLCA